MIAFKAVADVHNLPYKSLKMYCKLCLLKEEFYDNHN